MVIFLSHKMSGLSDEEVYCIRRQAIMDICAVYGDNHQFIDNYHHPNTPENAGRLWHLGTSIRMLDKCDAIYFVPHHWIGAKGCLVERLIAKLYKIKILHT